MKDKVYLFIYSFIYVFLKTRFLDVFIPCRYKVTDRSEVPSW